MAIVRKHGIRNRKLADHILTHTQEAEVGGREGGREREQEGGPSFKTSELTPVTERLRPL